MTISPIATCVAAALAASAALAATAVPNGTKLKPASTTATGKPKPVWNAEQSNGWYGAVDLGYNNLAKKPGGNTRGSKAPRHAAEVKSSSAPTKSPAHP